MEEGAVSVETDGGEANVSETESIPPPPPPPSTADVVATENPAESSPVATSSLTMTQVCGLYYVVLLMLIA